MLVPTNFTFVIQVYSAIYNTFVTGTFQINLLPTPSFSTVAGNIFTGYDYSSALGGAYTLLTTVNAVWYYGTVTYTVNSGLTGSGINVRTNAGTGKLELFGQPTVLLIGTSVSYNFTVFANGVRSRIFSIVFIPGVGDVPSRAAWSCLHVAKVYTVTSSDIRWVNPLSPFQVFCDQTDGYGWMKILQICEFSPPSLPSFYFFFTSQLPFSHNFGVFSPY